MGSRLAGGELRFECWELVATKDREGRKDADNGSGGSRAAKSWRVEGGASFGQGEGVQRINPLARVEPSLARMGTSQQGTTMSAAISQAAVNARYTYWQMQRPIPGGVAYENFELRERFYEGQVFVVGITGKKPMELGVSR